MWNGLLTKTRQAYLVTLVRESWSVSWPMTLIMFMQFIVGFCDVYIAGRFGKTVQAAYGLAFQTYFILSIMGSAISVGTVSVVSRLSAHRDRGACNNAVCTAMLLAFAAGACFVLIGSAAAPAVSGVFNVPADLRDHAEAFMRIYALGLLFQYALFTANAVLRSARMILASLFAVTVMAALNIVLNFVLSFHTPLGSRGIAVATVASTAVAALIGVYYLRGFFRAAAFRRDIAIRIAHIGWPAGILQMVWQMGSMMLYYILSLLPEHNVEIMAAFTNGTRIESLIFLPAFAFNMSNAVLIGNYLGRDERGHAFWGGLVTALIGVVIVVILTAGVLLNAPLVAGVLSSNPLVVRESLVYISIALLFEPVMAWGVILSGGLNGAGDTRGVMKIIALSVWLVRIPLCYLLAVHLGLGARSVWWSMNVSIVAQTFFVTRRYWKRRWLRHGEPVQPPGLNRLAEM